MVALSILEAGRLAEEYQVHGAGLSATVLGDDQLGEPLVVGVVRVVDLVPVDERYQIGVLSAAIDLITRSTMARS